MKREVTRAELKKALSLIGIEVCDGRGVEACHRFSRASMVAVDMWGGHNKMNGESNDSYVCLIVETKDG